MAVTKKHSELSGSSLHNPKGIFVEPQGATDHILTLDVANKRVLPSTDQNIDLGYSGSNEFRDVFISGKIFQNGYELQAGGGGGTGIFSTDSDQYGALPEDTYEATGSLILTGSLSVLGSITGSFSVDDLTVNDDLLVPGTVSSSAFYDSTNHVYLVSGSHSGSVFYRNDNNDNVFREVGNVGIGTNSPTSRLHIKGGNVDIDGGDLILDNNYFVKNALYGEPIFVVASGSRRSISVGLRGGNPPIGNFNVIIGDSAAETLSPTNTRGNVIVGFESLFNADDVDNSVMLGYKTGYYNKSGDNNVFIGFEAGAHETVTDQSNKLYIANSSTTQPLLYGNFDSNRLGINVSSGALENGNLEGDGNDFNISDTTEWNSYNLIVSGGVFIAKDTRIDKQLDVKGDLYARKDIIVGNTIKHDDNTSNYLNFSNDRQQFVVDSKVYFDTNTTKTLVGHYERDTELSGSTLSIAPDITASGELNVLGNITSSKTGSFQHIINESDVETNRIIVTTIKHPSGPSGTFQFESGIKQGTEGSDDRGAGVKVWNPDGFGGAGHFDEYIRPAETASFLTTTGSRIYSGVSQSWHSDEAGVPVQFYVSGNVDISGEYYKNGSPFYVVDERGTVLGEHSAFFTQSLSSGSQNTLIGYQAGDNLTLNGQDNTFIGDVAGQGAANATDNVIFGKSAGYNVGNADRNVIIGSHALGHSGSFSNGEARANVSGSIFIGYKSGFSSIESRTLLIQNNDSHQPLIYGDFENKDGNARVGINTRTGSLVETFTVSGSVSASGNVYLATESGSTHNSVGIGTTSPKHQLHIHSNDDSRINLSTTNGGSDISLDLVNQGDNRGARLVFKDDGELQYQYDSNPNDDQIDSADLIPFKINSSATTNKFYIDSVGIGINNVSPTEQVTIKTIGDGDGLTISSSHTDYKIIKLDQQSGDAGELKLYDGGSRRVKITADPSDVSFFNGNLLSTQVGIGTETPGSSLEISSSYDDRAAVIISSSTATGLSITTDYSAADYFTGQGNTLFLEGNRMAQGTNVATSIGLMSNTQARGAGIKFYNRQNMNEWWCGASYSGQAGESPAFSIGFNDTDDHDSHRQPSASILITNTGKVGFSGTTGLSPFTPTSSYEFMGTDNIIIPFGDVSQRGGEQTGSIRYNTEYYQFEGYNGNHWGSLGGVIDVDRDTKILAESPLPNSDNDELRFFVQRTGSMALDTLGRLKISPTSQSLWTASEQVHISGSNAKPAYVRIEPHDGGSGGKSHWVFKKPEEGLQITEDGVLSGVIAVQKGTNPDGIVIGGGDSNGQSVNLMVGNGWNNSAWDGSLNVWNRKTSQVSNLGDQYLQFQVSGSGETFVSKSLGIGGVRADSQYNFKTRGDSHMEGNLDVTQIVTALEYHTQFESASISYAQGSNKLGNTPDDIHSFTGSINHTFSSSNDGLGGIEPINFYLGGGSENSEGELGVGIGTRTPGQKIAGQYDLWTQGTYQRPILELSGSHPSLVINANGGSGSLYFGDFEGGTDKYIMRQQFKSGRLDFSNVVGGAGTDILSITSSGKVGIGTTTPETTLDVVGDLTIGEKIFTRADSNRNTWIGSGTDYWTFGAGGTGASSQMLTLNITDGAVFNENGTDTKDFRVESNSETHMLFIDSGEDKLGIGTDAPSHKFTVVGADAIGIDDYVRHNGDTNTKFGFNGNDSFKVRTSGTDRFGINATGVGIYTTAPASPLDVRANATANTKIATFTGNNTGRGLEISTFQESNHDAGVILDAVDASHGTIKFQTGTTDAMTISKNQDVGIGTTTPTSPASVAKFLHIADSDHAGIVLEDTSGTSAWDIFANGDDLKFKYNNTQQLLFNGSGKISIGTRNCTEALTVDGNISASGDLYLGAGTSSPTIYNTNQPKTKIRLGDNQYDVFLNDDQYFSMSHPAKSAFFSGSVAINRSAYDSNQALTVEGKLSASGDFQVGNRVGAGNTYGAIQLNQQTDNETNGFAILNSNTNRTLRLWVDANQNSYVNSGEDGAEILILNSGSGYVGIGALNPTEVLEVGGNISASGAINIGGVVNTPTRLDEVSLGMYQSSTNKASLEIKNQEGYVRIGTQNGSYGHIETDNNKFYFNKELVVNSGIVSSYNEDLILRRDTVDTTYNDITLGDDTFDIRLDNTERFSITADGSTKLLENGGLLSIGGVSPDEKVVIKTHTNNYTLKIGDNESGNQLAAGLNISGDTTMRIGPTSDSSLLLYTNNTARIRVNNDGNVQIGNGNEAPEALTVQGNISASGNIIANEYIIRNQVTEMTTSYAAGATAWGDTIDDLHTITGSLRISGSVFNIQNDGKVGIGALYNGVTYNPSHELEVQGTISSSGNISASSVMVGEDIHLNNYKSIYFGSYSGSLGVGETWNSNSGSIRKNAGGGLRIMNNSSVFVDLMDDDSFVVNNKDGDIQFNVIGSSGNAKIQSGSLTIAGGSTLGVNEDYTDGKGLTIHNTDETKSAIIATGSVYMTGSVLHFDYDTIRMGRDNHTLGGIASIDFQHSDLKNINNIRIQDRGWSEGFTNWDDSQAKIYVNQLHTNQNASGNDTSKVLSFYNAAASNDGGGFIFRDDAGDGNGIIPSVFISGSRTIMNGTTETLSGSYSGLPTLTVGAKAGLAISASGTIHIGDSKNQVWIGNDLNDAGGNGKLKIYNHDGGSGNEFDGVISTYQYNSNLQLRAGVSSSTSYKYNWSDVRLYDNHSGNGKITFSVSGSERMRITNDGKVGIGKQPSADSKKLEIDGSISASGDVFNEHQKTFGGITSMELDSFDSGSYRTCKYIVQCSSGSGQYASFYSSEILVLNTSDGGNSNSGVLSTEYAKLSHGPTKDWVTFNASNSNAKVGHISLEVSSSYQNFDIRYTRKILKDSSQ